MTENKSVKNHKEETHFYKENFFADKTKSYFICKKKVRK